jgi:hypothetical protein
MLINGVVSLKFIAQIPDSVFYPVCRCNLMNFSFILERKKSTKNILDEHGTVNSACSDNRE